MMNRLLLVVVHPEENSPTKGLGLMPTLPALRR